MSIRIVLGALAAAVALAAPAMAQPRAGVAAAPMQRAVSFVAESGPASGVLVLPLTEEADLDTRGASMAEADRAAVRRALVSAEFNYNARQTLSLRGIGEWDRIFVIGLGDDPDALAFHHAGAVTGRALVSDMDALTVLAAGLSAEHASEFATGLGIGHYRSDIHTARARSATAPGALRIVTDAQADAQRLYSTRGRALVRAMTWVRDISNEPANIIYPESFVQRTRSAFSGIPNVRIEVLDVPAMQRLGMGAILGVGQGSERPPRMLILRYRGAGAPDQPIVLAGKGITFDSGGISIKPGANMGDMKMDMSGAASVVGAVMALAEARAPVNVIAIAALAENMPDGGAIRPGDVLTAMNGTTIEIISTDAEGRLVLADALSYADARLNPAAVIDVATLTGAVGGALGDDFAGLFTRHDALADQLSAAGETSGERLWRLPLDPSHGSDISSTIADIKNSGGSGAGASTGAYFIGEFINREIPWAHLDIAGVAFGAANDWRPAGSAGYSVRLLERFVRDYQPIPRGAPGADAESDED